MKKCCESHKIDFVCVHGLRHTNAPVMLSLGIIAKAAMARGRMVHRYYHEANLSARFNSDKEKAMDTFFQNSADGIITQKASAPSQ